MSFINAHNLESRFLKYYKMAKFFPSKEKSLEEIRHYLEKFSGGSVDLFKRDDGLAIIEFNHEGKRNAMSGKMMVDLEDTVQELESWSEGKAIILKGSSGHFCSGGDLDFVKRIANSEEGFMMSTYMHNIMYRFQRLPMISVALIEGSGALGGGAELTTACDFRLITETCKGIGFVQAKMGLLPAWGGANRLVEIVGYTNALELLSTARIYSPEYCLKIGLVNNIISQSENSESFVVSWLQQRTNFESNLTRNIKGMLSLIRDSPGNYELERRIFAPFWGGPENLRALSKNIKHKPELEN